MRAITNCPACQTQFFVTEVQLNQHSGKVRCGHCLHVFDAKQQIIESDATSETNLTAVSDAPSPDTLVAATPESNNETGPDTAIASAASPTRTDSQQPSSEAAITSYQPSPFDDFLDKTKLNRPIKQSKRWLWLVFALLLLLVASVQSIYYLRNEIAIYYPTSKPYLVKICEKIACSIDLPRKIEFIVIDDSDIQEDAEYAGLMRLSSTLINLATFRQAYPNLELTLTDVEDKPKLRRIFKPSEYLAKDADIANGLAPGEEIKIKLAMTTQGESVAGYRVFVTY